MRYGNHYNQVSKDSDSHGHSHNGVHDHSDMKGAVGGRTGFISRFGTAGHVFGNIR